MSEETVKQKLEESKNIHGFRLLVSLWLLCIYRPEFGL